MVKINIEKKHLLVLLLFLSIVTIALVIASNPSTKPNPGHASNEIMVNIGGADKTLQQAIDDRNLGTSNIIWESSISPEENKWGCLDIPIEQCDGKGCLLKFKAFYSPNKYTYAHIGTLDYDAINKRAVFGGYLAGSYYLFDLGDNSYSGPFSAPNLLWFGDCSLTSIGTCVSGSYNNLNLCVMNGKLDAFVIKY